MVQRRNDHILEVIFSFLRWFFLIASVVIYVKDPYHSVGEPLWFILLVIIGVGYMGMAELALRRLSLESSCYIWMTRGGVIFDYAAYLALIILTGGTDSPLLPIGFLITLHASVYWGLAGGLLSAFAIMLGQAGMLLTELPIATDTISHHLMNFFFVLIVGFVGGVIVARERKHYQEKAMFEAKSRKDYLTGLDNHRSFQETLRERSLADRSFILVMADIDYFKSINDKLGHLAGDQVLRIIGRILEQELKDGKGTPYRYGGEEFALILHTCCREEANQVLESIRQTINRTNFSCQQQEPLHISMSFGAAVWSGEGVTTLVEKADKCLYEAKRLGRNRIIWELDEEDPIAI